MLPKTPWVDRVTWRIDGGLFTPWIMRGLAARLRGLRVDLCYVDGGEWVTPKVISLLRKHAAKIINYNIDDPLGPRDGARFKAYRRSLPYYDLNAVVRQENVAEADALGAKNVMRVYRSADEISHAPRPLTAEDHQTWDSEVLFLGTWFPERGSFLLDLIRRGVPLTIRGPNWHKAPEWPQLKNHWKGGAIAGDDYAKAIQCAKVNLGLLSKENRDLHTTRSLEIPALASLLCAERTGEHMTMYSEGKEALFWKNAEECAAMCHFALDNENRRQAIAVAGHRRVIKNGHYNEMILTSILATAGIVT
ncbi:MAG: glycosyltransferase [Gallionellaceae bacterium]|nr:glycosyltransferase [Gallionellaceae bacterium]